MEGSGHRRRRRRQRPKDEASGRATEDRRCLRVSAQGQPQDVVDVGGAAEEDAARRSDSPSTLLTAMETAGKTLDEKELSDAMKETGLGTPATRAPIIEVLLKREYIVRSGKSLEATDKGIRLIEVVHPEVKSPAMTGQWEAYLKRIERGQAQLEPFMTGHRGLRARGGGQGGTGRQPPRAADAQWRAALPRRARESRVPALTEPSPAQSPPGTAGRSPNCCTRRSASRRSAPIRRRSAAR